MYYEEAVIEGVLHWRSTPNGTWTPFSPEALTVRIGEATNKSTWALTEATRLLQRVRNGSPVDLVEVEQWLKEWGVEE